MKSICKQLGVTESGLHVLFRLKRGDDISGGQAGDRLERQGLVTKQRELGGGFFQRKLTDAGLAICEKARALGYGVALVALVATAAQAQTYNTMPPPMLPQIQMPPPPGIPGLAQTVAPTRPMPGGVYMTIPMGGGMFVTIPPPGAVPGAR